MQRSLKYFFEAFKKNNITLLIRFSRLPKFIRPLEKKLIVILLIVIVIFSLAAVFKGGGGKPAYGGTYMQGFVGQPKYINPILAVTDIDASLSKFIYSGLTKIDENGEPIPDVASSWQVGDDAKTYTFMLNQNIYWHDNTRLTANDIVYTYNLIKDPTIQSPFYTYWKDVEVDAIDDDTVAFKLKDYSPNFLWQTTIGIVPEHVGRTNLSKSFVGSGPYKYAKVKIKNNNIESITLTRNSHWYNNQPPYIDSVETWFYNDKDSAIRALKSQKIHAIDGNGVNESWLNQYIMSLLQSSSFFINSQSDLFNDVKKRDVFLNSNEPISARSINVVVDNVTAQDNKFTSLKSGWEARGAIINLTQDTIDQIQKTILPAHQYDIIAVSVDSNTFADRYPYWHSSQADGSGLNFSRYKNNDLDKLLTDYHKSTAIAQQKELAENIDQLISDQELTKELSRKTVVYDIAKNIHISQIKEGASSANRFDNFNLWYIKTRR